MAEFYASCPESFEDALADELRSLELQQVRKLKGRVSFAGEAIDAERACLWSRLASRVFVVLARIDCPNADSLYAGAGQIAWERVLRPGSSIAVTARGTNDELRNSHFAALRVKDAVCDRLTRVTGTRPAVDTEHPDARIALSIRGDRASIQLDLSGEPLFKRLPREAARAKTAPVLRPDYAALVLHEAGWLQACARALACQDELPAAQPMLVDIACSGGGLELEAASMLLDRAPGLLREHWGFACWAEHDADAWQALVDEADAQAEAGASFAARGGAAARIVATDVDGGSREFARRLMRKAGLARYVQIVDPDTGALESALRDALAARTDGSSENSPSAPSLHVVADVTATPLNQLPQLLSLAFSLRAAGAVGDAELASALAPSMTILTRDDAFTRMLGKPARALHVKPGNEDARIVTYAGGAAGHTPVGHVPAGHAPASQAAPQAAMNQSVPSPSAPAVSATPANTAVTTIDLGDGSPVAILVPESEQFANRLRKVARLRRKWAKREGITCYRVYDADLPDYSAAIDLYEGSPATPGRWLVIAEYAAPSSIDPALAQARLLDILALAPRILQVEPEHVYAKARTRSRGGSQYAKQGGSAAKKSGPQPESFLARPLPLIEEGSLTFAVNFDDYLDTGIFLDHRVTRGLVREHARGKRYFLNLFAYTGTATCYAADAGVEETVTVDLSNNYLDWAERNMRQNGFTGPEHHYVRSDVMRWISDMRRTRNRWDLIFCDPPTFSNSSKMGKRTWDVQRDHVDLLVGVSRLLTRDGEAIFSCNLRTFKPDIERLERAGVALEDISAQTIPEDFARNPRIHRCYLVKRLP